MIWFNILFTFLHILIIVFNLTGWIWKKTRKAHLIVVGLTFASWFLLGLWKGLGYCFLTDWHWQVKEKLGERALPNSFIKYAADKITGQDIDPGLVDMVTLIAFIAILLVTIYVNLFSKSAMHPTPMSQNK